MDPAAADARLRPLWALTLDLIKGRVSDAVLDDFPAAGYGQEQLLDVILAIALKTMSNDAGRLARPDLDPRFVPYRPAG